MGDGRKRLSGAEYKKKAKMKKEEQEQVIRKTIKIDNFFKSGSGSSIERPGTSTTCTDTIQSGKDEMDLNSAAQQQQQSSVEQSSFEKTDIYVFDEEAVEESSISIKIEDASQNQTLSNDQVQTTVNLNKDPALWEINDTLREIIARYGFDQNKSCDFTKSEKLYADQRRFLPVSIFQRKMKNNEVNDRNWLVYSESKRSVYCGPCLAFGPLENKTQFENEGFNDWKNAEHRVAQHENSARHKSSILSLKVRSEIDGRLDNLLHVQIDEEITYWRNVLKRVVAVVKRLCSRGLAFRGKNEKFGDPHNGNYCMILELLAEFDPFLASHIERFGNQGSGSTSYLSKTVCDEFIHLMGHKVLKQIGDEIRRAKYFSLIIDSTPDIAHVDQLTLVIRYVLETGEPCERFLKFLPSVGHKAEEMYSAIISELKTLGINIEDCRGQSYDNASNMSGVYNGLQAKIKSQAPFAFFVPCSAHSLNLVATAAAESCTEACRFFMLLQEIYVFFVSSTQRWQKLMTEIGKGKTLKRINLTRWSAREDACRSLRDSWHEVLKTLESIKDDCTEKPVTRNEATGILLNLEKLETAVMVVVWNVFLERINKVNVQIQASTVDLITVADLYESLCKFFVAERENFKYFEETAMELSVSKQYTKDMGKRQPIRKKIYDETPDEEMRMTASDTFRVNTFLVLIDRLVSELEKRQEVYNRFNEKFSFLTKMSELSSSTLTEKALFLEEMYPNDLETDLVQECIHFQCHLSSERILVKPDSGLLESLSSFLRKQNLQNVYPNLDITVRMALCTPATNCSGERSFSCLKRVKNYLRSTLSQEKLNALALLCIESELMNKISYDDIIDDFANRKSRKKKL